ncbi:hypothetical protein JTB14_002266 [Gonioctena quinquepunctata]|nr:hypothetical protein JTB14_002266 [Gonioctena quinquepunctata]
MKCFVIFNLLVAAVCFVQAQTPEQVEKIKSHHAECSKQINIDPQLMIKARQGEFSDEQILKDYLFCVSKKSGFFNDKGELQKDVLLAKTSIAAGNEDDAKKLVDACAVQQKDGPDTTFHVVKCFYEKSPQHISVL